MVGILRKYGAWLGFMVMMFALMLSGCTSYSVPKDLSKMTPEEEAKIKEAAINYIKTTYQKDFVVTGIEKDRVFGETYAVKGYIQDGKKTPVIVGGDSPDNFRDTYLLTLWSNELKPHITEIANKTMDLRKTEHLTYG